MALKQCLIYSPAVLQLEKLTQVSELNQGVCNGVVPLMPLGENGFPSSAGYRDHLCFLTLSSISAAPNLFGHQGTLCRRQLFHGLGVRGGFRMIQGHWHLLCTFFLSRNATDLDRRYWSAAWRLGTPAKASHTWISPSHTVTRLSCPLRVPLV